MRRLPIGLALFALWAAPAQAGWRDVAQRDSPRSAVATCLRSTAAPGVVGLLGPLERGEFPYDVLRAGEGALARSARLHFGDLIDCPAIAADPGGTAVVAAPVDAHRRGLLVRAAVAQPGGGFAVPVTVARSGVYSLEGMTVAVSPRGDAVVAWVERRSSERRRVPEMTRVVAALRPAGGPFGKPDALTRWRRDTFFIGTHVAAAMDAAGTATVAWSQEREPRGDVPDVATVRVATAPAGAGFGSTQTLVGRVQDTSTIALAVAPDGSALLAYDGQEAIWPFERRAGSDRFTALPPLHSKRADWQQPTIDLAPDGSAVIAWRTADSRFATRAGVVMMERRGHDAFSKPRLVWAGSQPHGWYAFAVITTTRGGDYVPNDDGNTALRVALQPDGSYLLAWGANRRTALGDRPTAVRTVEGVIGAEPRLRSAGCPCRDVNGLAPLELVGGTLGLAFTDNVTTEFTRGFELAARDGRLRVAAPGPALDPAPPSALVVGPPPTSLRYGQGLPVDIRCMGPCDLRAYVLDPSGRARGLGTARRRAPGRTRVTIRPGFEHHLAPEHGERARVLVRAWAPGGVRYSDAAVPVRLRRAPLPPLPQVVSPSAVRRGNSIVVSWRTSRPLRGDIIEVEGRDERKRPLNVSAYRHGRGKTRFRVQLRSAFDPRIGDVRWVSLTVIRGAPPHDRKRVLVPVTG